MHNATVRGRVGYSLTTQLTVRPALHIAGSLSMQWLHPVKTLMTKIPRMEAYGCNKYSTVASVWISADKKTDGRVKAGIKNKVQITAKSKRKNGYDKVKAGTVIKEEIKNNAEY